MKKLFMVSKTAGIACFALMFLIFGGGILSCKDDLEPEIVEEPDSEGNTDENQEETNPDPEPEAEYSITVKASDNVSDNLTWSVVETAAEGAEIDFSITVSNLKYRPDFTIVSGEDELEYVLNSRSEDGALYSYSFTMPAASVVVNLDAVENNLLISTDLQNIGYLWVYNAYNGFDDSYYDAYPTWTVGFKYSVDFGFSLDEPTVEITDSGESVTVWWNEEGQYNGYAYQAGWAFTMPAEPVTIKLYADEKTDYAGKSFVGDYYGYFVGATTNNMTTGSSTFDFKLKANTSYSAVSTDSNSYDFKGIYVVNDEGDHFDYDKDHTTDPTNSSDKLLPNAAEGQILSNGDLLVRVVDLVTDTPDNVRFYFASTEECTYTCASREGLTRGDCLLEVTRGGSTIYYYLELDAKALSSASVDFSSGSSIAGDCVGIIYIEGESRFKYEHTSGSAPVFTAKGSEAGTYTGSSGDMVLDGFGGVTFGGQTGTYVMGTGIVTVTINGEETEYMIDLSAKTYEAVDTGGWKGYNLYYAIDCTGNSKSAGTQTKMKIFLGIDRDYNNNVSEGNGFMRIYYYGTTYKFDTISSSSCEYVYDGDEHTITYAKLTIWDSTDHDSSSSYSALTFNVSTDFESITSPYEYLYKSKETDTYIYLKGVTLKGTNDWPDWNSIDDFGR